MQNPQVHWSDGIFLRPHHFQATDRHWTEQFSLHNSIDHPLGYGLGSVSISTDALSNGVLEISNLRARLRDGTTISWDANHIESVDLSTRLKPEALGKPLEVFLAVPRLQDGPANVAKSSSATSRYLAFAKNLNDESSGGREQSIELRRLNYRLVLSTEETAGLELLPIVKLNPVEGGVKFAIDPKYYPPCTSVAAWPDLVASLRDLRNFIGSRIKTLSSIIEGRDISMSTQVQGDLEKIWLMSVLNEAYAELSCFAYTTGVHPLTGYERLCSILGRCAIFGPKLGIDQVLHYDHDDLATIYRWTIERIKQYINSVKDDEAVQRFFIGAGPGMHVALEPEWFGPEWEWYFGVSSVGTSLAECARLFADRKIDLKLGSSNKVEVYMTNREAGLRLRGTKQVPAPIQNRGKWIIFHIDLEGDPWQQVKISQSLGLRIRRDQIANLDTLEGSRRLHLHIDGRSYGLEFAIFAIKNRM